MAACSGRGYLAQRHATPLRCAFWENLASEIPSDLVEMQSRDSTAYVRLSDGEPIHFSGVPVSTGSVTSCLHNLFNFRCRKLQTAHEAATSLSHKQKSHEMLHARAMLRTADAPLYVRKPLAPFFDLCFLVIAYPRGLSKPFGNASCQREAPRNIFQFIIQTLLHTGERRKDFRQNLRTPLQSLERDLQRSSLK